ncbi:MAG TPA: MFS transporter [Solirubrobacteraceae bacterium]|nr:MFS transporter [Solirubrobacteraceae bacterium]
MSTSSVPAVAGPGSWSPRRWLALGILLAAGFMDLLDTSIVNVAIPSIRRSLHANYAVIQWMIAGYVLAVAVALITGGRLGDMQGRKRVFLLAVAGFGLMSLACGLAPTPTFLVAARVLQGLCAAMMIPQILSVIQVSFPREEQRKALALYSSVAGVAVMSGPLLAGLLLNVFGLGWRSIFLINVPVSVVVIFAALAVVPESRSREAQRLDLAGVSLVSSALFALVFGVIEGRELGWPGWVFALMAAAVPLLACFALYERRKERGGSSPLISITLFRQRSFSAGLVVVLVFFSGLVGFYLAFTIFLQLGLGYTPLQSALTTFPSSVGLILAAQASTRLAPRLGRSILAVGALVMAAAQVALILIVHHYGSHLSPWDVRPVIFAFGLGMGLILPSLADVVIGTVPERHAGSASGVINTGMQVGNGIGVAVIGVILFSAIGAHAASSAAAVTPQVSRQLAALSLPDGAPTAVVDQFKTCFVDRSQQEDPAAVPPSCRAGAGAALPAPLALRVHAILTAAGTRARKDDFVAAIQRALMFEVGVFVATMGLLFLLPGVTRAQRREAEIEPVRREVAGGSGVLS